MTGFGVTAVIMLLMTYLPIPSFVALLTLGKSTRQSGARAQLQLFSSLILRSSHVDRPRDARDSEKRRKPEKGFCLGR